MVVYKRKIVDDVRKFLGEDTVVVIYGARQVGKTHVMYYLVDELKQKGERVFYIDLEDKRLLSVLDDGVESFLSWLAAEGYKDSEKIFVFVDEIQYLDDPSNFIKLIADHYKNIHLVVSGSSTLEIKTKFRDSLVGRTVNFEMYGLSFEEFLEFKGKTVDLKAGDTYHVDELRRLYKEFAIYGSYPKVVLAEDGDKKERYLMQIIETYLEKDVRDLGKIENVKKFNDLLAVLAANSGQLLNVRKISKEIGLSVPTVEKYLSILEETLVIKLLKPYSKNPLVEISKNPKVFFYDSGLMSFLWLKTFSKDLVGNILETSVFGELVKRYGRRNINFWRTKAKQEIDFIITKGNRLVPVEVKTNLNGFEARAMNSFVEKYKIDKYWVAGLSGEKMRNQDRWVWEI